MMRYFLTLSLAAILALSACNQAADTPVEANPLSKTYPVALQKIADGVWVHTSNYLVPGRKAVPSNGLIIEDGDSLIMVDTAWGEMLTQSLLNTIEADIGKPVKKLVITHHHPDRLAGVDVMEIEGAEVFTHPLTPIKALKAEFPVPNTSVAALKNPGARTKVGPIEVAYPGPGYAEENLVVYVPAQKILFGGSAILGAEASTLGNLSDANLKAWPQTLNWIKATYPDTQTIVPAHGKGSDLILIDKTLGMIAKKVNADAEKAKADAATESEAPVTP
ncbi:subclass B1 metallo-beta-lactamase [Hellea sp.]|nr:subclass B1 metallo-beta-lactamase [Hellea sp.]